MCSKLTARAEIRDFEKEHVSRPTPVRQGNGGLLQDHVPVGQRSRGMWRAGWRVSRERALSFMPRGAFDARKPFSTYSRKRGLDASHVMVLRSRQTSHCAARSSSAPKSASPPPRFAGRILIGALRANQFRSGGLWNIGSSNGTDPWLMAW